MSSPFCGRSRAFEALVKQMLEKLSSSEPPAPAPGGPARVEMALSWEQRGNLTLSPVCHLAKDQQRISEGVVIEGKAEPVGEPTRIKRG